MQQHAMRILWPSLAGVIIGTLGVGAALLAGGAGAALAVLMLLTLRNIVEPERGVPTSPIQEVREGIRYSFESPVLKMLMVINFAVAFFGLAYLNMAPGFAREVLDFDATTTGFFVMASGIGSVTASVGLVFRDVRDRNTLVVLGLGGYGLALLMLCLNPFNAVAFVLMAFFGFSNSCLAVTAQAIMQTESDQRYLGRVVALWSMGGGIGALTAWPIGAAGDEFGLRYSLGFVAAMMVLSAIAIAIIYLPQAKAAATGRLKLHAVPAPAD
jgi:sugar phosphate permease